MQIKQSVNPPKIPSIANKYLITNTDSAKTKLYWFFYIIWTIYGVVAFLPYEQKNTAYNILDLFSKNLFSVFLVIIILKSSNSTNKLHCNY